MKLYEMTAGDWEAAGARAYDRDEEGYQRSIDTDWDPGEDEGFLEHLAYMEIWLQWANEIDREHAVLVEADEMWVDPRISEQVAA